MSPTFVMPAGPAAQRAARLVDAAMRVAAARCAVALAARATREPAIRELMVVALMELDDAAGSLDRLRRAEGI